MKKNLPNPVRKQWLDIENEVIGNLIETFEAKSLPSQLRKQWSVKEISGNITLAYYRGYAVGDEGGMIKMAKLIVKKHPELKKEMEIFIDKNKQNKPKDDKGTNLNN